MCRHEKCHPFSLILEPRLYLAAPPNGNKDTKSLSADPRLPFCLNLPVDAFWISNANPFQRAEIKMKRDSSNFDAYYIL